MSKTYKAIAIVEQARKSLLEFALYEIKNIIQHRIKVGEMDEYNPDDEDANPFYEVDIDGDAIRPRIPIAVEDTYSLETYSESRTVSQVLLDAETDTLYIRTVEGLEAGCDTDNPICINSLDTDSIKWIVVALEDVWGAELA